MAAKEAASPEPAHYSFSDGQRDVPGTAAYYKSWTFRQKAEAGTTHVPGHGVEADTNMEDSVDGDYYKKSVEAEQKKSLVVIFGRTNVRRASTQRKADLRMQKTNRRLSVMIMLRGR